MLLAPAAAPGLPPSPSNSPQVCFLVVWEEPQVGGRSLHSGSSCLETKTSATVAVCGLNLHFFLLQKLKLKPVT